MNRLRPALLVFCLLWHAPLFAAELTTIQVDETDGSYRVNIVAIVNADAGAVTGIIRDYENLPGVNPYLVESDILAATDDVVTVSMLTEVCILFLCYQVRHVQDFTEVGPGRTEATVIPARSDLLHGWISWQIKPVDAVPGTTEIRMAAEMMPDFFILPWIGPYQMKRMIVKITADTIQNVEHKAKQQGPPD